MLSKYIDKLREGESHQADEAEHEENPIRIYHEFHD